MLHNNDDNEAYKDKRRSCKVGIHVVFRLSSVTCHLFCPSVTFPILYDHKDDTRNRQESCGDLLKTLREL